MQKLAELSNKDRKVVAGIMSGTSVDGVDVAIIEIQGNWIDTKIKLIGFMEYPYPAGLKDDAIDNAIKIVSICNYYDYLTQKLPGKETLTPREAVLKIYALSGIMFNPMFVKAFINDISYLLLEEPLYPIGSIVLLGTKEFALIESVNRYSDLRPLVYILSNSQGNKLPRPILVNLKNDPTRQIQKIVKLAEPKTVVETENTKK